MPAKSKAQQKAAEAALAAKRGEQKIDEELKGARRSMSEQEQHAMTLNKRRGKPSHVTKH